MTGDVPRDLTGRRLGHYRIDGTLGRGGMSVLYRATDMRLGRTVALKVIGEHLTEDPEFRERFVDEARNTSAIDHANIVPVYDFGEADGWLYIAMRMVDGSDLATLIARGAFPPARALGLLGQVADALDTLHAAGLVHLDVKPANVLVTSKEATGEHVYLADFGLTRRGATGHRTRGGDFLGSPTYAAPEHLRGEPVDGRTDAYSLACVLFACLSGRPPYRGDVQDVIAGHLHGEPPSVNSFLPANQVLPWGIDDVLRRALAKRPDQRFANCRELIAAAGAVLQPATGNRPQPIQAPYRHRQPQGHGGVPGAVGVPVPAASPGYGPAAGGYGGPRQPGAYGGPAAPPMTPVGEEPMRLRPPAPAATPAFGAGKRGRPAWLWPVVIGGLAAVALVVVLVLTLGGGGSGSDGSGTGGVRPSGTVPNVPVGPGSTSRSRTSGRPPPTVLPTVTGQR